jgi:putative tryptophan/tyrosine transport system substrate-binding protein
MTIALSRRDFITGLGGTAVWPLAASAQQSERMRRIGVLMGVSEKNRYFQMEVTAFEQPLKELGWERSVAIFLLIIVGPGATPVSFGLTRQN